MSGHAKVLVSLQNGPIAVGDRITSSDIAGVGMRANTAGQVVGIATEPMETVASGSYAEIDVFVNAGYWAPEITSMQPIASGSWQSATFPNLFAMIVDGFKSLLNITFDNGLIKTVKGMFDTVEVKKGVTTIDEDTGQPYCIKMKSGQLISTAGECGTTTAPTTTTSSSTPPSG